MKSDNVFLHPRGQILLNIIVKIILFHKQYKMGGSKYEAGEDAKYFYIKVVDEE